MTDANANIGHAGSKVILLGEHAVVHHKDALVIGLAKGMTAHVTPSDQTTVSIPAWSRLESSESAQLNTAMAHLMTALGATTPLAFTIHPEIPPKAGMGASASLGLSAARAANQYLQLNRSKEQIFNAVIQFENVFHHNTSGIDIHAAAQPGCSMYHREAGLRPLAAPLPPLLIVYSGQPGATKDTVRRFQNKLQTDADGQTQLDRIEALVHEGTPALETADWKKLGHIMTENHRLLQWFGVSSPALDHICRTALQMGALGAKLTGGGGGGCAILLTDNATVKNDLENHFLSNNYQVIS